MQFFRLYEIPAQAWQNGRGTTRVITTHRGKGSNAAFDWRISVAEVVENGPFSVFSGIDRIAVVLENGPLRLYPSHAPGACAQPPFEARLIEPVRFDGGLELHARITDPVLCLNVMTRHGAASAQVRIHYCNASFQAKSDTMLFAAAAGWTLNGVPLARHDGVLIHDGTPIQAEASPHGGGPLIEVSLALA